MWNAHALQIQSLVFFFVYKKIQFPRRDALVHCSQAQGFFHSFQQQKANDYHGVEKKKKKETLEENFKTQRESIFSLKKRNKPYFKNFYRVPIFPQFLFSNSVCKDFTKSISKEAVLPPD